MQRREFLATTAILGAATLLRAAEPKPKLRVAVVGHTGRGNYGHGLDVMWLDLPGVEVVGVADADAKGLAAAQAKLRGAAGYADYRKMFAELKPDIVSIAPRFVDEHHPIALAACEAGVRGIYCEKSFVQTPAESDDIVAACDQKKVKLALAHRNRYHPVLPVIKKMIEDGTLGKVTQMVGRGKEDQRGGGLDLHVLGSHVLNLANYFGGASLSCTAKILKEGKPAVPADVVDGAEGIGLLVGDELHADFELKTGIPLAFHSVKGAAKKDVSFGLDIICERGKIDFRIDAEPLAYFTPADAPPQRQPITTTGIGKPEPIENLGKNIASHRVAALDLIEAIQTGREPLCSARDGQVVMEMINAVFESHVNDGKKISLPSKTRGNALANWK